MRRKNIHNESTERRSGRQQNQQNQPYQEMESRFRPQEEESYYNEEERNNPQMSNRWQSRQTQWETPQYEDRNWQEPQQRNRQFEGRSWEQQRFNPQQEGRNWEPQQRFNRQSEGRRWTPEQYFGPQQFESSWEPQDPYYRQAESLGWEPEQQYEYRYQEQQGNRRRQEGRNQQFEDYNQRQDFRPRRNQFDQPYRGSASRLYDPLQDYSFNMGSESSRRPYEGRGQFGSDYERSQRERFFGGGDYGMGSRFGERSGRWEESGRGYQSEMSHRGKGPKGYKRSDERIREDISDRLSDDYQLDASEIEVRVDAGEVILTGTVESRNDKRRAEDIVESIPGVRNVENRLHMQQLTSSLQSKTQVTKSQQLPSQESSEARHRA